MQTWFVTLDFGYPSMRGHILINAETYEQAYDQAYHETAEWAAGFDFVQDEAYFSTTDEVGRGWDDEAEEYEEEGCIDPGVELYVPEEHDDYL